MDPGTIIAIATAATSILSLLSKYVKDVKNAQDDVDYLLKQIQDIQSLLQRIEKIDKSPHSAKLPALDTALKAIRKTFSDIQEPAEKLKPKPGKLFMSKVGLQALKWPFTKEQMANYITRLEGEKTSLILALQADSITVNMSIDNSVTEIMQNQGLAEQDRQLAKLAYADGAAFNSHYRVNEPKCVPNTRVDLLRTLHKWSVSPGKHIFWLNGMAGMGKSTIARTVAYEFSEAKHLGASFFFSKGGGDLGNSQKFVTTIALQLARSFPCIKSHISDAIRGNENITCEGGLRNQWKELILEPLSQLTSHQILRITLVIDALDECAHEQDVKSIIWLFAEAKDITTVDFKIFVTSRPETPIRLGFRDMPEIMHQDLALQNIPRLIIEKDITIYLRHELLTIRKERQLPSQWPGEEKIQQLAEKSDCLFIYVSTACLFIRDSNWHPDEQLSFILQDDIMEDSPTAKLDSMYTQVLKQSIFNQKQGRQRARLSARFKQIVGAIIVLFNVLPAKELAALLLVSPDEVTMALNPLHSVLNIPEDVLHPIRLLHPSFRDFLLDEKRCADVDIRIEADEVHATLVRKCLRMLSDELKRDICGLKLPGAEVNNIQTAKIESCLSQALQYACHYWVGHLEKISQGRLVETGLFQENGQIHQFFTKDFLHWLEAISLTRKVHEGVLMIIELESLCELIQHNLSSLLSEIVYDAKRFILSNRSIIEKAPLQVYASALIFSPRKSIIRNHYLFEYPAWVERQPLVSDNWNSALQTLDGHNSVVLSVIFSPDCSQLASASHDSTIRLWDAKTGASLQILEGHTDIVCSVAFSPDGSQLASASGDSKVRLWDAKTGASLQILEGHTDIVYSVTFSPDGSQLASASYDSTVRLWDANKRTNLQMLKGHTDSVTEVAYSPDGSQLASASDDHTIRLWDAKSGANLHMLKGHTSRITSVAFSPHGRHLASASEDGTVRLWDVKTAASYQTLDGHTGLVTMVAFSPDGSQLASASSDSTVRLWNAKTGTSLQMLEGHNYSVTMVAFSPDGSQLASASGDNTIRLWDAKSGANLHMLKGHTSWISSVAFSLHGRQLASASVDSTVRLWDAKTAASYQTLDGRTKLVNSTSCCPGNQQLAPAWDDITVGLKDAKIGASLQVLKGHTDQIESVVFSPDGSQLASASYDKTVRLWDAKTGTSLQILETHTRLGVEPVVYSPDGSQLASVSYDNTVRLWDVKTGANLQMFEGHTDDIYIAFSPNGSQLASASHDCTVRLWDTKTGTSLHILEGHTDFVISVAFSPDGSQLASASNDNTVRLWDTKTGTSLHILEGHTEWVHSVAFTPDGSQLASASVDNTVRLWNAKTGANLQILKGHTHWVKLVRYSPDGTQLASSSWDNTIRLWDPKNGKCLQIFDSKVDPYYDLLSFEELWIETQKVEIQLTAAASEFVRTALPFCKGSSIREGWLRWNSVNALWLPAEFRKRPVARHKNLFAIADSSYRVQFLELSSELENILNQAPTS